MFNQVAEVVLVGTTSDHRHEIEGENAIPLMELNVNGPPHQRSPKNNER